MINICNVTMILGRLFLATIHAKIDVFNKDISLGIRDDMVTFNMDKKIHNFTTPVGKIYMINSIHNDESPSRSNAPSGKSSRFEKSKNLHNENNYIQERSSKKTRILKADTNLPSMHFCKPVKSNFCNGLLQSGQSFICVTKELMDALPLGRENGSRIREIQWKEGPQKDVVSFSQQRIGIRDLLDSFSCGKKVLSGRNHIGYAVTDVFTA
ncbi:hypothetical protein Tco_0935042 [Tanacetum coccineum]